MVMNKEKFSLLVPMAASAIDINVPIQFRHNIENGFMNCIWSVLSINLDKFTDIYFIYLKEYNDKYNIKDQLKAELNKVAIKDKFINKNIHFYELNYPTTSQAATIYATILDAEIEGPICIKDTDNLCETNKIEIGNYILSYSLEDTALVDPQHKSYIDLDDHQFITNTIEKRVVSDRFNCGGYVFGDSNDFCIAYNSITDYADKDNHLYMSHIIYWLTLYKDIKFRPIECTNYIDFEIE